MGQEKQALLRSISAYVPGPIARRAIAAPRASVAWQEEWVPAALLFADVSGFTAMSESLARLGKEGAEELTRVLNAYFTAMIDLVHSYGGQVIKFGGDAVTCAFTNLQVGKSANLQICKSAICNLPICNLQARVLRACACAMAMQERMAGFRAVETRSGVFELRMKIGVSAGSVLSLSVGEPREGLEYVLAGQPLDRMAQAEHHAAAGEVVMDGACLAAETSPEEWGIVVGDEREGFLPVKGLARPVEQVEENGADWDGLSEEGAEQAIARLVPYLPPTVYEQIVEGQRQFVGEHRHVVSLFVNFFGLDYDADLEAGWKLQRYFTAMQGIIHRYGGRLNRVITGDKGSLLHLIFGAPVAHEDNEVRALGCALEIQRSALASDRLPFITDQRIGIASGHVFAGDVGSERRREYTVMGDVVNLSARLMQAAGTGEILLDRDTARRVEDEFICQALAPVHVKGKQEPVPVCRAFGVREEAKVWAGGEVDARRRAGPIVGREQELARIAETVERAVAGHGQLLVITGEAGTGKSRLLEELVALARQREKRMRSLGGNCLSYGSQSPYLPWIDLLNSFFGLRMKEGEKHAQKVRRIEQRMVEADPALKDWVPLMAQLLGLPVPDNELTGSLDAQLRKQRTFDITLTLLRHQAQQVPLLLIVFEDIHWIDAISLEMLNHVARNVADHRILLVALHRPTIEMVEWKRNDGYNQIRLDDLPAKDALKLVQLKLGMAEVPALLHACVLRGETQVNPFFVEEVINSLVDRGYLVPKGDGEPSEWPFLKSDGEGYSLAGDLSQVDIPDSVQALVMSRIDQLDESSKLTVKVASVIGRTFKYRTLRGIYPVQLTPERLRRNLERLSRLDLTPLDRPAPEWEYIFKHVITQEVAYESLLYAHRRELHHRVGKYLEGTYADSLEEHYELLAHHYYHSDDPEKSWHYLVKAGDRARDQYANEAAIAHYSQALSLDSARDDAHRVYESLGDVYRLIGQYENTLSSYRKSLERHPPTAAQVAEIRRKIAKTWELQGRYDEAMHYLHLTIASLGDETMTPEVARIYGDMGWIAMQQGDYEEALQLCTGGLDIAGSLSCDEKSHRVKAELQHTLGTIYLRTGDYARAAAYFQTCIEVRESVGDLYGTIRSYNNLAHVYWSQSDYDLAAEYMRKSLEISRKIGHTYGTAMCTNNLGVIYYTLGDYPRAIEHYERSLRIRKEIGDVQGIADTYNNLGEVHHALGNRQQARDYLQEAARLFIEIGDKMTLMDAYRLLAEVELALEDVDEALEYCQRSLDLAQEIGNQDYEGIAYRVLGQIHRIDGRPEEAREYLQNSVEILETTENRLELGRSTYELGLTLAAMGLDEGRKRLQQAVQIFEELGVEGELEKARAALADS
jgi:predicted ATPase/class 3 adenylate cyclase